MLSHYVHISGIWLKQNTLWQLTILNHLKRPIITRHSIGCLVWKEIPLSGCLVNSLWLLELVGRDGFRHFRQTHKHKSRIPCPIFGESRFPGNSQIPDPINIFIVFPIPAPYFGQIPNPENTLPDPQKRVTFSVSVKDQKVFFCYRLTSCALSIGFHGLSYNQAARSKYWSRYDFHSYVYV